MIHRIIAAFIGNLSLAAARWGFYVAIVKCTAAAVAEKGVADLTSCIAVAGPIFLLLGGALRQVVAVNRYGSTELAQVVLLRCALCVGATGLTLIVGHFLGPDLALWLLFAVALMRAADGMSEVLYANLQSREDFKKIACLKALRAIIGILTVVGSLMSGADLTVSLFLVATSWTSAVAFLEIPLVFGKHAPIVFARAMRCGLTSRHFFLELMKSGSLLCLAMSIAAATASLPAYFLEWVGDRKLLAIYGGLYCFVAAQQMIYISVGQCLVPRVAGLLRRGDRQSVGMLAGVACGLVLVSAVGGGAFIKCFGESLLGAVYNNDFARVSSELAVLLIVGGVTGVYSVCGSCLTAGKVFGGQIFVSCVYGVTQVCFLLWFLDEITIGSIAIAQLFSGLFGVGAMYFVLPRLRVGGSDGLQEELARQSCVQCCGRAA